ncbi:40S ribosomal protein S12 [Dimargaris cristalligena]|uniref:40S ribosomal protein S12 n=1 Tax=Dimargaris cristalligena TaxID=215637 RepID=A0A4V1J566_9FUNG|nr:40S ribosomal protein S12 [Dimargaris cristalligena]RKP37989.1 putative 40S ribosomal protein S12 [Dimargaris cristalligena]|eukprot:RKP37989.1 putative 40S ribosomal protein S12 [Dimargaris cristalligena]
MASEGDVQQSIEIEVSADASAPSSSMTIEGAIQDVLRRALIHNGLVRGLRECAQALDSRRAQMCVLSDSCDEAEYTKLVEALCAEHKINLIKVSDPKKIGEWAGLCKIDREGNARKVVGCSCVVISNWGEDSEARNMLLEYFKSH